MLNFRRIMILWASLASVALADEIVTLKDGREIRLRDNFTWEYLGQPQQSTAAMNTSEAAETRKQLDQTMSDMAFTFLARKMELNTATIRARMGEDPNGVQVKIVYEKRDADLAKLKTAYDDLTFRLRSAPKAQEALTELYLYWKASMGQIARTSAETDRMFELRIKDRERGLRERMDRLDLTVGFLPKSDKPK